MYILKNAWISIIRNKGRNVLIAIIIVVIAAACTITLSIRNSATKIVKAYEEKYDVEATIGMNRQNLTESFRGDKEDEDEEDNYSEKMSQEEMIETFNNIESLTEEEIKNYGDSEYVSSYYYVYNTSVNALDIEEATDSLVKETTTTETTTKIETFGTPPSGGGIGGEYGNKSTTNKKTTTTEKIYNDKAAKGAFTLLGYSSYESMTDFINGTYKIVDGEVSSDFTSNSCVISQELATLNDLEVGDTITLVSPNDEDITYELTITGIFTEDSEDNSDMTSMFSSSVNSIITNDTVVKSLMESDEELTVTLTPTFILTSKDVVDEFAEEVTSKGLSEYYTVTNNVETVESATKSVTNVKTFATTFLIITLIIGGVVLLVINMINIRERKYEIGVLRTIGMKKITVIGQFMIELLIVCIFGLVIGAGIGAMSSVKVANNLLASEISNSQEEYQTIGENFGNKDFGPNDNGTNKVGVANVDQIDSINAVVDYKVLLELFTIGILLTAFSSISACIAISRFSPLMILKERS